MALRIETAAPLAQGRDLPAPTTTTKGNKAMPIEFPKTEETSQSAGYALEANNEDKKAENKKAKSKDEAEKPDDAAKKSDWKKRAKRALITNLFPLAGAALYGAEKIEKQKEQK